jgi:hypothetical protein
MSIEGKATRPRVLLFVLTLAVTLVFVAIATFGFRPVPEPPPPTGKCTQCGAAVLPIHYGLLTLDAEATRPRLPQSFPQGRRYFRHPDPKGDWLEGGCGMSDGDPGWICEGCGKTWMAQPLCSKPLWVKFADWFWNLFR